MLHILRVFCITILMTSPRNAGVLGASGYAGAELLRLLARHPDLEVAWAAGDQAAGQPLVSRYPGLRAAYGELAFCSVDEGLEKGADVLFCALPARPRGRDRPAGPGRGRAGRRPVGRLPAARPGCLPRLVRGGAPAARPARRLALRPARAAPRGAPGATRVAVPGCYPTAALLALAPLVAAGLVATDGIVVDAKSGLSGAGRSLADGNLFVQANENVNPYKVGSHRHTPEIEQELALAAGAPVTVTFTPHLVPATRGILATCYATLAPSAGDEELAACYAAAYAGEPFVDLLDPATGWPATRAVATTNRAQVAAAADRRTGRVVAAAAIDNLVKGAAGQAVQCANLALGLPETAGLDLVPPGP